MGTTDMMNRAGIPHTTGITYRTDIDTSAHQSAKLSQKQALLEYRQMESKQHPIEQQVEEGRQRAHVHAERINELAEELAKELKALKDIADEISPSYWRVYYKPFITGFNSISVPHVRSDGDVWTVFNQVV